MPSVETQSLQREIHVNAKPETVFSYLMDPLKLSRWMCLSGTWDPKPGATYRLQMSEEDVATGKFVEVQPPNRLVLTWGFEGDDAITKPGSSTVEITLTPDGDGTLVRLVHRDLPSPESTANHSKGWEYLLGRLAVVAIGGDPGPNKLADGGE